MAQRYKLMRVPTDIHKLLLIKKNRMQKTAEALTGRPQKITMPKVLRLLAKPGSVEIGHDELIKTARAKRGGSYI